MKAYTCACGWSGSTQAIFVGHLSVAHGLVVTMPPPTGGQR